MPSVKSRLKLRIEMDATKEKFEVFDVKMTYLPQLEHEQSEPQLPTRRFTLAGHSSFIMK